MSGRLIVRGHLPACNQMENDKHEKPPLHTAVCGHTVVRNHRLAGKKHHYTRLSVATQWYAITDLQEKTTTTHGCLWPPSGTQSQTCRKKPPLHTAVCGHLVVRNHRLAGKTTTTHGCLWPPSGTQSQTCRKKRYNKLLSAATPADCPVLAMSYPSIFN